MKPPTTGPTLFLTNHRGGGIGDFGLELGSALKAKIPLLEIEETRIDGRGSFAQSRRAGNFPGCLVVNLGLTAWGRSGLRNYIGFASVGRHARSGRPTQAIVHHAIEQLDLAETGYRVTPLLRWGAHRALGHLQHADLTVFSPRLKAILREQYGFKQICLTPLPGSVGRQLAHATGPGRPRVVSAGYWAPYKGIDLFLETARRERNGADFFLVGQPHAGLNSDHGFRELVARWRKVANEIPVATPGFLEGPALDRLLSGRTIGVLPYTSVSGASASFRLFSERGVPVVASDLPEFRYLQEQGAGLVLVPPAADAIGEAVRRLILEPRAYEDLISRQLDFSARTSWPPFVSSLLGPKPDF